jgi:hypothetical protein
MFRALRHRNFRLIWIGRLLPIFAQDVLHVGARGYGWYSAPAVGAVVTSGAMVPVVERSDEQPIPDFQQTDRRAANSGEAI